MALLRPLWEALLPHCWTHGPHCPPDCHRHCSRQFSTKADTRLRIALKRSRQGSGNVEKVMLGRRRLDSEWPDQYLHSAVLKDFLRGESSSLSNFVHAYVQASTFFFWNGFANAQREMVFWFSIPKVEQCAGLKSLESHRMQKICLNTAWKWELWWQCWKCWMGGEELRQNCASVICISVDTLQYLA